MEADKRDEIDRLRQSLEANKEIRSLRIKLKALSTGSGETI